MEKLTDELLMEAYQKALDMHVDKDFILLLEKELSRRKLSRRVEQTDENG
ncbi:sporulation histidine kinase inhibitor Sda [Virgibacillus ainsalahensis]